MLFCMRRGRRYDATARHRRPQRLVVLQVVHADRLLPAKPWRIDARHHLNVLLRGLTKEYFVADERRRRLELELLE
jgi:hypothetical protein